MNARATTPIAPPVEATTTVRVPLTFLQRGGAKRIIAPPDSERPPQPARHPVDAAMIKALARAHRWERMLRGGAYGTITELAAAERINASYLARVLRLTLLAPDIVEALLDGSPTLTLTLQDLLAPFPVSWDEQRRTWLQVPEINGTITNRTDRLRSRAGRDGGTSEITNQP